MTKKQKHVVVILDDEDQINDVMRIIVEKKLPHFQSVHCANLGQFRTAVEEHQDHIACIIVDDRIGSSAADHGSLIAENIRAGEYGKAIRDVPVAVMSGLNIPVQSSTGIAFIPKPASIDTITQFIKTGRAKDNVNEQDARNHNAIQLLHWLEYKNAAEAVRHGHSELSITKDSGDRERLATMRHHFSQAFTNGKPDRALLLQLQDALEGGKVAIESESLALMQGMLFAEMGSKIREALKPTPAMARPRALRSSHDSSPRTLG